MSEDESLVTFRWSRRLTRTHAVLWVVIIVATVLDVVTTVIGLAAGYQEANVVARTLMEQFGLGGLWALKVVAMVWLVGGWAVLSDRNAAIFLALFALVTVATVGSNVLTLLGG